MWPSGVTHPLQAPAWARRRRLVASARVQHDRSEGEGAVAIAPIEPARAVYETVGRIPRFVVELAGVVEVLQQIDIEARVGEHVSEGAIRVQHLVIVGSRPRSSRA